MRSRTYRKAKTTGRSSRKKLINLDQRQPSVPHRINERLALAMELLAMPPPPVHAAQPRLLRPLRQQLPDPAEVGVGTMPHPV